MKIQKTFSTASVPVWQTGKSPITAQGGFTLVRSGLTAGSTIPAGTPISLNEATRKATIVKTAVLQANAGNTATAYKVLKGHQIKVGDYLAASVGGAAYAVTVIDTSDDDYDELTVGTTLGVAVVTGQALFVSVDTGASAGAVASINGLLYEDTLVEENCSVSVVLAGVYYARRTPALPATVLSTLPKTLIASQSF